MQEEKMNKICLTTVVYGDLYCDFIPFLIYSCHQAYPEYDILIYVCGKLPERIKNMIADLCVPNAHVFENCFKNIQSNRKLDYKCLRWVLWDERFRNYDYLYVVDVDILYCREPIPLCEQHIQHMKITNMCYDNIQRSIKRTPFHWVQFFSRIKRAGFTSLGKFIMGNKLERRVTGLHFVNVKQYFSVLTPQVLKKYENEIVSGKYLKYVMHSSDEIFLYHILEKEGLSPEQLPMQTDSVTMLDFEHVDRLEFRPHQGLHLGIFRCADLSSFKKILLSTTYAYYVTEYQKYKKDMTFMRLLENTSPQVKKIFSAIDDFYSIG